jgi:hypothetical protein
MNELTQLGSVKGYLIEPTGQLTKLPASFTFAA